MKTSHCHGQAQGLPFDIMPDHNREVDDLDYCAIPCGATKTARPIRRVCSPRCERISTEQQQAHILAAGNADPVNFSDGGRVLR
jgi:hypothetical protein